MRARSPSEQLAKSRVASSAGTDVVEEPAGRAPIASAGSSSASRIVPAKPGEHDVDRALLG